MMSAAVHGSVFASPGPATVLDALRAVGHNHPGGFVASSLLICQIIAFNYMFLAAFCCIVSCRV